MLKIDTTTLRLFNVVRSMIALYIEGISTTINIANIVLE